MFQYTDGVGKTVEENSSVFSLIRMRQSFSALTLLVGWQEGHPARKKWGDGRRWALISPDGVVPSWMVAVSASVNLPLFHKVQKFSSGTGSPGWSQKKAVKRMCVSAIMTADTNHFPLPTYALPIVSLFSEPYRKLFPNPQSQSKACFLLTLKFYCICLTAKTASHTKSLFWKGTPLAHRRLSRKM